MFRKSIYRRIFIFFLSSTMSLIPITPCFSVKSDGKGEEPDHLISDTKIQTPESQGEIAPVSPSASVLDESPNATSRSISYSSSLDDLRSPTSVDTAQPAVPKKFSSPFDLRERLPCAQPTSETFPDLAALKKRTRAAADFKTEARSLRVSKTIPDLFYAVSSSCLVPEQIIQSSSEMPEQHLDKNDVVLDVQAPTVVPQTPGEFDINVVVENRSSEVAENLNVSISFSDDNEISLVAPVPQVTALNLLNYYKFSFKVKVDRVSADKRVTFCIYVTQNIESEEIPIEYLVTKYRQQVFLPHSKPRDAVIIIPGISGSELFSARAQQVDGNQCSSKYRFWPPEGVMPLVKSSSFEKVIETDFKRLIADLHLIFCDNQGNSKADIMPSNPILDCRNNPDKRSFGTLNVYQKLVSSLVNSQPNLEIILFPYDWRRSNAETAIALEEFVDAQQFSDLVIVAHSMGGLVVSSFLSKEENQAKVSKFIALGTPFLGAPKALNVFINGEFLESFLGRIASPTIKEFAKNCPSLYELLPPAQSFNPGGYIEIFEQYYKFFEKNERDIDSFEENEDVIESIGFSPNAAEFLARAQAFHESLYDSEGRMSAIFGQVPFYNIVGYGKKTIAKLRLEYHHGKFKKIHSVIQGEGDGTVLLQSSTLGGSVPEASSYYVKDVSHLGLISDDDILALINNIIAGEPEVFNPWRIRTSV